jgi:hypothetical protein
MRIILQSYIGKARWEARWGHSFYGCWLCPIVFDCVFFPNRARQTTRPFLSLSVYYKRVAIHDHLFNHLPLFHCSTLLADPLNFSAVNWEILTHTPDE